MAAIAAQLKSQNIANGWIGGEKDRDVNQIHTGL